MLTWFPIKLMKLEIDTEETCDWLSFILENEQSGTDALIYITGEASTDMASLSDGVGIVNVLGDLIGL